MSTYSAFVPTEPDVLFSGWRLNPVAGVDLTGGTVTTYYYRTLAGTRGSTTSLSSVPAGAVIERTASL